MDAAGEVRGDRRNGRGTHGTDPRHADCGDAGDQAAGPRNTTTTARYLQHRGGGTPNASRDPSLGGLGGFNMLAYGSGTSVTGPGGVGPGHGMGTDPGSGGDGIGFGTRGSGCRRAQLGKRGGTKAGERAVRRRPALALSPPTLRRKLEPRTTGSGAPIRRAPDPGAAKADAGATALGVLPFLAAGQTHKTNGPYRGLHPKRLDLAAAASGAGRQPGQGLRAADVLARSGHHRLVRGLRTQQRPHHRRRRPRRRQLHPRRTKQARLRLALQPRRPRRHLRRRLASDGAEQCLLAGLNVGGSSSADSACKWFDLVKCGPNGCNFQYQANTGPTPSMTAVGLLCRQYMGRNATIR